MGYAGAAANATKLAGDISGSPTLGGVGGGALDALGIYGGLQRGGVGGYGSAALDSYNLYNTVGQLGSAAASGAGTAAETAAADAAASSAAGTAAGTAASTLGQYVPVVGMLLSAYLNSQSPAVTRTAGGWKNMIQGLQSPHGGSASAGDNAKYFDAVMEESADPDQGGLQLLKAMGISPTIDNPHATQDLQNIPVAQRGVHQSRGHMAKGGNVKNNARLARLKKLYESSYAGGKRHFDDGGYVSYFTPDYGNDISSMYSAPSTDYSSFQNPTMTDLGAPGTGATDLGNPNSSINLAGLNNNAYVGPSNDPGAYSSGSGGGGGGGNIAGAASGLGSLIKQYGALAPILGALLGGGNKQASAPATPAGYGAIPSIATPNATRSYTQPNVANWYTYGQGPEQSFFNNNQLPYVPGVSPASAAPGATSSAGGTGGGGATTQPVSSGASPFAVNWDLVNRVVRQAHARGGPTFDSTQGDDYVPDPGHGDGTSDGIDAKLSGGEYVMDAGTVSMLGNGSNEAGARALDQLRQRVRQHAGKHLVKGKQFMKAKPADAYLKGGKGAT
jgi:hypothetical protein